MRHLQSLFSTCPGEPTPYFIPLHENPRYVPGSTSRFHTHVTPPSTRSTPPSQTSHV